MCGITFSITLVALDGCASTPRAKEKTPEEVRIENLSITDSWNRAWLAIRQADEEYQWQVLANFRAYADQQQRERDFLDELVRQQAEEAAYRTRAASYRVVAVQPEGVIQQQFRDGFLSECDGTCGLLAHVFNNVVPCESSWYPYAESPYGDGGLAQFKRGTWASVGGGDIYDPFTQGRNVARMLNNGREGEWGCW